MSLSRSLRYVLGFAPAVAALGLLGGCDESGGKPAEFPKVEKAAPVKAAPAAPEKGLGRTGSEAGTPPAK
jgi:hypothetical protein